MVNVIHERAKFHRRVQQSEDNVKSYIRGLFEIADLCDFETLKDEQVRDQLVVGISDKQTAERLQLQQVLMLEMAIELCRTREQVKSQMAVLHHSSSLCVKRVGQKYTMALFIATTTFRQKNYSFPVCVLKNCKSGLTSRMSR